MPFSSLPPELVHQVIESTVPSSFHTKTYEDRQKTICQLSLVSRQFRSFAQPLLIEIARIKSNDQLKLLLRDYSKVVSRELILEMWGCLSSKFVGETIGGASNLRDLTMCTDYDAMIDLSVLSSCPNLVNLRLSGGGFDADSLDMLPSLQTLSLNFRSAEKVPELLNPRKVPALKALGLENIDRSNELEKLKSTRIDKLLPQVDALCVEFALYRLTRDSLLANFEPRTLVTTRASEHLSSTAESLSTVQHLRIEICNYIVRRGRLEAIQAVSQTLKSDQQSKSRQLRSIYLDPDVQPVSSDTEEVHQEFLKLEEECKLTGVDLVFEMESQHYYYDSYIPREFCRRQRKFREEEQSKQVSSLEGRNLRDSEA
ncbi:hypothetical protein JCM3765_003728 [Sporobolomyces pararoseus]